ncbi:hypothetical protein CF336_g612 [Tilletia laevis]|nr:hypothetical protein CF336_g612 [Tilletia laevis]
MMPIVLSSATTAPYEAASSVPPPAASAAVNGDHSYSNATGLSGSLTAALLAGAEQKSLVADHLRSSDYHTKIHALRKQPLFNISPTSASRTMRTA